MIGYGFTKSLALPFEQANARLTGALKKEGFGVLTEIPIQEKLKEKLGVDFPRYHILGACHPPSAYGALQAEEAIGLLLPCNAILCEKEGRTMPGVIRPTMAMETVGNPGLRALAEPREHAAFEPRFNVGGGLNGRQSSSATTPDRHGSAPGVTSGVRRARH